MNENDMFAPDYTVATGLLKHLNSEELKELLNDDVKLDGMIRDLQQIKNIENEKEMVIASNKSIAEYNLSLKPTLEEYRSSILHLYTKASSLKSDVIDKKDKLERKKSVTSLGSVLAVLQAKAAEVEELTEVYVENMLTGEVNVDEFLNLFLTSRTEVHILHTKVDKMTAILQTPAEPFKPGRPARNRKAPSPPIGSASKLNGGSALPLPIERNPRNPFITPYPIPPPPLIPPLAFPPFVPIERNPRNPFITPYPIPPAPLIPPLAFPPFVPKTRNYVVPTRVAPRPPPVARKPTPKNSLVEC